MKNTSLFLIVLLASTTLASNGNANSMKDIRGSWQTECGSNGMGSFLRITMTIGKKKIKNKSETYSDAECKGKAIGSVRSEGRFYVEGIVGPYYNLFIPQVNQKDLEKAYASSPATDITLGEYLKIDAEKAKADGTLTVLFGGIKFYTQGGIGEGMDNGIAQITGGGYLPFVLKRVP